MKPKNLPLFFFITLLCSTFTSCGDDDNGVNEWGTLPYEAISGLYTTSDENIKSIELIATGDYVIIDSNNKNHVNTFSFNADNTINLNEYGELELFYSNDGDDINKMILTPTDSSSITLSVTKQDTYEDIVNKTETREAIRKICRKWIPISGEVKVSSSTLLVQVGGTFNQNKKEWTLNKIVGENDNAENFFRTYSQVIYANTGTFLETYTNGYTSVRYWSWDDSGSIVYGRKSEGNGMNAEEYGTFSILDNKLTITLKSYISYNPVIILEEKYVFKAAANSF